MFIVGILSWWYTGGLIARLASVRERIISTVDYFSIDLLLTTLFAPFRQISAGKVSGSASMKWRAFVDRFISRCIGAIARTVLIVVGILWIIFTICFGAIAVLIWLITPLVPVLGIMAALIGWVPSWR